MNTLRLDNNAAISGFARWIALTVCATLLAGTGCQNSADTKESVWSTKENSIINPERATASKLDIEPGALDDANVAKLRKSAIDLLTQAAKSDSAMVRANAIEALHVVPEQARPVTQSALGDANRGVRFVAAMTVGKLEFCDMTALVTPLLDDESQSVQAAAIYALRMCGESVDPTPLANMVLGDNPEAKGNAAMILGELGNESADRLLLDAAEHSIERVSTARARMIELQIAESLVKLGHDDELEVIRAALFVPAEQGELSALAAQMCGRLQDGKSTAKLLDLAKRSGQMRMPAEIRLAAVEGLTRIAPDQAPLNVPMEYVSADQYQVRAQAAMTLGQMGRRSTLQILRGLMNDPNPVVQVAAAGAVLRVGPADSELSGNRSRY